MTNRIPAKRSLAALVALLMCLPAGSALAAADALTATSAATPAESFVSGNLAAGMVILDNKQLTAPQRKAQFQAFLLNVIDMKRIAAFTLGKYGASASAADQAAFDNAFQDYAVAVYQSYFMRYSGQTLTILHSAERAPTDFIVATSMSDPHDHSGQPPLEIDFRVRTDGPKPVIVDFSIAGIWMALAEQADFAGVLAKSGGNVQALIAHLHSVTAQY